VGTVQYDDRGQGPSGVVPNLEARSVVGVFDRFEDADAATQELQRAGYAAAFRNPRVIDAIRSGPAGAIAVTYVQWSGARTQEQVVEWTTIRDDEGAWIFADRIQTTERRIDGGSTSISGAIDFSARLLARSGLDARRRVIDVSGDGVNNNGRLPHFARDDAVAAGITVNGLVLLGEEPLLDRYYTANVIGGAGAFVTAVADIDGFAEAILDKLIREIAELPGAR
jgi:hypothetical protein